MEIVALTKDLYPVWDSLCYEADDAWFWQTSAWLEYTLQYRPENKTQSLSFMVYEEGNPIAGCLLTKEEILHDDEKVFEFSFGGGPIWAPFMMKGMELRKKEEVQKHIFQKIDSLAFEYDIKRAAFRQPPLSDNALRKKINYNYFYKYGYYDLSLITQIIDLSKRTDEIKHDIRKGHKYDINRGLKLLKVEVFDCSNINDKYFDEYRQMHHKSAGRQTRPQITFDLMKQWVQEGKAVLFSAYKQGVNVGHSYVFLYKGKAYYGSSCKDPEMLDFPISHVLQWTTIETLKKRDIKYYEIGWQYYTNQPHHPVSDKELAIAHFKRGFGGFSAPLFTGEKYYSRKYFLSVYNSRANQFAESFNN